ncbi:MAG TPA: hypothetical protein VG713_10140, partial [Pirellulales bacterium]|nr:hypothetical protein [Pirellulales bacterium]
PAAARIAYGGHAAKVNHVALSRVNIVASADDDGEVHLWQWDPWTNTHRMRQKLERVPREQIAHHGSVRAVAFTPFGDQLATVGDDGAVRVWHTQNGKLARQFKVPEGVAARSVAFSGDGTRFVVGCSDHRARVWLVESSDDNPELTLGDDVAGAQPIEAVTFYDRGSGANVFLAAQRFLDGPQRPASAEWTAWATNSATPLFHWRTDGADLHRYGVTSHERQATLGGVAASGDSAWLAAAGPNQFFTLWHADAGRLMLQRRPSKPAEGEQRTTSVAFNRDGRRLAVASDREVRLWDWQIDGQQSDDPAVLFAFSQFPGDIAAITFSQDEQFFAVASGHEVRLYAATAAGQKLLPMSDDSVNR